MTSSLRRLLAAGFLASLFVVVGGLPAAAHVSVSSAGAAPGATDVVLTFRTPNEMSNAATVRLQVFLPTKTPLLGVLVAPVPGWRVAVRTAKLKRPVQTDDGAVTSAVSEITWSGGRIPVGGYRDFDIDVGALPDVDALTFKALQTYSNGKVIRWIETAPEGSPEPSFPAPVLRLVAPPAAVAASTTRADHQGRNLAITALAVALVALWVAVRAKPTR